MVSLQWKEKTRPRCHPDPIREVPPCCLWSCYSTWALGVHSSPQPGAFNSPTNMSWISPPLSQIIFKKSARRVTGSTDSTQKYLSAYNRKGLTSVRELQNIGTFSTGLTLFPSTGFTHKPVSTYLSSNTLFSYILEINPPKCLLSSN